MLLAAKRDAMSPDQIISYWKPEVAIRLVNDFTHYPAKNGRCRYPLLSGPKISQLLLCIPYSPTGGVQEHNISRYQPLMWHVCHVPA
jgi:hypothetical protein